MTQKWLLNLLRLTGEGSWGGRWQLASMAGGALRMREHRERERERERYRDRGLGWAGRGEGGGGGGYASTI